MQTNLSRGIRVARMGQVLSAAISISVIAVLLAGAHRLMQPAPRPVAPLTITINADDPQIVQKMLNLLFAQLHERDLQAGRGLDGFKR